jgi:hypothetical protein
VDRGSLVAPDKLPGISLHSDLQIQQMEQAVVFASARGRYSSFIINFALVKNYRIVITLKPQSQ